MGEKETMPAGALERESPTRASTGREASGTGASEPPPGAVQYRESDFDFAARESPTRPPGGGFDVGADEARLNALPPGTPFEVSPGLAGASGTEGPPAIPGKPTKEQ